MQNIQKTIDHFICAALLVEMNEFRILFPMDKVCEIIINQALSNNAFVLHFETVHFQSENRGMTEVKLK